MSNSILMLGDCLERMKEIDDEFIDFVLTDPPYGTTACKWDSVIPLDLMWKELKRIIKPNGAIAMTASQPFTTKLISSNMEMFKYCWIWDKIKATNFFAAKFQPLNNTEDVVVFSKGGCNNGTKNPVRYNPQGLINVNVECVNCETVGGLIGKEHGSEMSMSDGQIYTQTQTNYPFKTLKFNHDTGNVHPTQKPVALMEYLIKTYTNKGEIVLDFTMGSGTTGVAAITLNRKFIGIELDSEYFKIASDRITSIERLLKK